MNEFSTSITVVRDKQPSLKKMQEIVGGYIEVVYLWEGDQMIVNEEGLLQKLDINREASRIAQKLIVGDVIILKGKARME